MAVATTTTRNDGQQQHNNQHDNQYDNNTMTTATMNIANDLKEDGQRHHPAGVERGVLNRVKEVTMLGTGGRLRRLAAMVGGEYARDDSR